jgi:hypothetical protein
MSEREIFRVEGSDESIVSVEGRLDSHFTVVTNRRVVDVWISDEERWRVPKEKASEMGWS